jgi:hypothetical protein
VRRLVFCVLLVACKVDGYPLDPGLLVDGGDGDDDPFDVDGDVDPNRPDADPNQPDARTCTPIGPDDTCDNLDNDCNGVVDDPFDKTKDPENCGECGHRCLIEHAESTCTDSQCVVTGCLPGFADLDPGVPGCEYDCPVFPAQTEQCNGVDEDCDGVVDDGVTGAPTGLCRTTPGTPCAGTPMVCETRGGVTAWYCDYAADVEFDPSVPNGIALQETKCDGKDGDCDGQPDDAFTDLGQECDNGMPGACRDPGERRCDPADATRTICDLAVPPAAPGMSAESCNGVDDDCDGIVDNPTGPGRVIDDMVQVTSGGVNVYVYRYEATRPDATASSAGLDGVRACSKPDALPWTQVTFAAASAACAAAGKRLCTGAEWQAACEGAAVRTFPYGNSYAEGTCNGEDFDGEAGGADDDVLIATGAAEMCTTQGGLADMSGNAKEWTNDVRAAGGPGEADDIVVVRGGDYATPEAGLTCRFDLSRAAKSVVLPTVGFRCCSSTAP